MASIGYATLAVVPSAKGFADALSRDVSSSFDHVGQEGGSKIGRGILATAKPLIAPLAGLAAAAGFGALIGEAARASDAMQKFGSTLQFAGVGTDQIKTLTASVQDYANKTVYDIGDIANITAQLASNAVPGFDKLAEAAGNLNAVAGGNAETFKSVGMVLTQTAGQGTLTTENFNQLSDAIPGASGKIQKALLDAGAYTGNFRDAMAKGQITAEEFNAAVLKLGFDPVAVSAARSTKTIEGALGNLRASAVTALSGIITTLKPAITGSINAVSLGIGTATTFVAGAFPKVQAAVAPVFRSILTAVAPIAPVLASAFGSLAPQLAQILPVLSPVGLIFRALTPVLPQIAALVGTLAAQFSTFLGAALRIVTPLIATLVDTLSTTFVAIMPTISGLLGTLSQAFAAIGPVLLQVVSALAPLITQLVGALAPVVASLVTTVLPPLATIFGQIVTAIAPLIATLAAALIPAIQALLPVIVTVFNAIVPIIQAAMQIVQGIIQVVIGLISGNWSMVWTGIQNIFAGVWNAIQAIVIGALNIVLSVVTGTIGNVSAAWSAGWSAIGAFFSGIWNSIVGFVRGAATAVGSAVSGLVGSVRDRVGDVVGFVSGLPGRIVSAIGNLGSTLYGAGEDLVRGFLGGIKNLAGNILGAIEGPIKDAISGAKALLGIHSPSRVFHQIGVFTGQGLALGIASTAGQVARATDSIVPSAAAPSYKAPTLSGAAAGGVLGAIRAAGPATIMVQNPWGPEFMQAKVDARAQAAVADYDDHQTSILQRGFRAA